MGFLRPVDPNTGAPIANGSFTAVQSLASVQEKRAGDSELCINGTLTPPVGNVELERIYNGNKP